MQKQRHNKALHPTAYSPLVPRSLSAAAELKRYARDVRNCYLTARLPCLAQSLGANFPVASANELMYQRFATNLLDKPFGGEVTH